VDQRRKASVFVTRMIGEVGVPLAGPIVLGLFPLSADLSVFAAEHELARALPFSLPGLPMDSPEHEYTPVPPTASVVVTGYGFVPGEGWAVNPDGPPPSEGGRPQMVV
jgi:hypothetical protein